MRKKLTYSSIPICLLYPLVAKEFVFNSLKNGKRKLFIDHSFNEFTHSDMMSEEKILEARDLMRYKTKAWILDLLSGIYMKLTTDTEFMKSVRVEGVAGKNAKEIEITMTLDDFFQCAFGSHSFSGGRAKKGTGEYSRSVRRELNDCIARGEFPKMMSSLSVMSGGQIMPILVYGTPVQIRAVTEEKISFVILDCYLSIKFVEEMIRAKRKYIQHFSGLGSLIYSGRKEMKKLLKGENVGSSLPGIISCYKFLVFIQAVLESDKFIKGVYKANDGKEINIRRDAFRDLRAKCARVGGKKYYIGGFKEFVRLVISIYHQGLIEKGLVTKIGGKMRVPTFEGVSTNSLFVGREVKVFIDE